MHALAEKMLRFRRNHAVVFRDQKPGGLLFPSRAPHRLAQTFQGDWLLIRCHQDSFFFGGIWCNRIPEGSGCQPEKAIFVWLQGRRLGMCGLAPEYLANGLALVGNNRRNIDQGVYLWIVCGSGRDNGPAVRVADQDDTASLPAQYSF